MEKVMFVAVLVLLMVFQGCNSKEKSEKEAVPVVDNSIVSASFSPDGKKILVAHKKYVLIHDTASGAVLKKISEKTEDEEFIQKLFSDEPADKMKNGK
ncbi:MAG: hypothetical protein Q7R35_18015 [Elusimicrobiota bacterium]|nr:hypothetical protein [Elusimicrobiota bacterium]